MKKLLVLVLVLSMVTMASAALKISTTYTGALLNPSDTVTFGIYTDAFIQYQNTDGYAGIIASPGGSIDGQSGITLVADTGCTLEHSAMLSTYATGLPTGADGMGVNAFAQDLTAGIAASTPLFSSIVFHCDGPGDVVVSLVHFNADFAVDGVMDSIVIHQIPEPMTMGLLGLGGLFLRRRSK